MASLDDHMRAMAAYNAWANDRLYAVAASLPYDTYRREAGAFFGSLHGTLNHLLVVDRLWLRRLTGDGDAANRLDVILYEPFEELRQARVAEDARVETYVAGLSPKALLASFDYATTSGVQQRQPSSEAWAQLFSHQPRPSAPHPGPTGRERAAVARPAAHATGAGAPRDGHGEVTLQPSSRTEPPGDPVVRVLGSYLASVAVAVVIFTLTDAMSAAACPGGSPCATGVGWDRTQRRSASATRPDRGR